MLYSKEVAIGKDGAERGVKLHPFESPSSWYSRNLESVAMATRHRSASHRLDTVLGGRTSWSRSR